MRSIFTVPEKAVSEFSRRFPTAIKSCVIHVRRGDYVEKAEVHNLLPLDYFKAAILLARKKKSLGTIFIFSDDIAWVQNQTLFTDLPNVVFVHEPDSLLAFYLMMLAAIEGIICSNSTFCWWVAFLSEERFKNRFKIFPDRWDMQTTLSGRLSERDCGNGLFLPYMTSLQY